MKTIRLAAATLLATLAIPAANAASFHVNNNTGYPLTLHVNGTHALGTVLAHSSKTVSEADFRKACGKGEECLVQAYVVVYDPPSIYAGGIIYNEKQSSFFLDGGDASDISMLASLDASQLNVTFTQDLNKK